MGEQLTDTTRFLMKERFGKDSILSLATCVEGVPYVRTVNGYYEDGAFYIITYGLSNKMKQLEKNPLLAVSRGVVHSSRNWRKPRIYIQRKQSAHSGKIEKGFCFLV